MRVSWALVAEQDRADIVDYIAQDNPLAAIRMDELFEAAVATGWFMRCRPTPCGSYPQARSCPRDCS